MIIKFRNFITEELTGKFKDETEIIYRDKDLVCMIPKSQMTSNIYGQKTNWCQVTKTGFDNWSGSTHEEVFLLIRFLFKNGKKIRFTYFDNDEFYWANETGYHVLQGSGNPFEINSKRDRIRDIEKDILDNISKIPEKCKSDVLEFIDKNKKKFKYIIRDEEYNPASVKSLIDQLEIVKNKYNDKLKEMIQETQTYISFYLDKRMKIFHLNWAESHSKDIITETFTNVKDFEKRLCEVIELLNNIK